MELNNRCRVFASGAWHYGELMSFPCPDNKGSVSLDFGDRAYWLPEADMVHRLGHLFGFNDCSGRAIYSGDIILDSAIRALGLARAVLAPGAEVAYTVDWYPFPDKSLPSDPNLLDRGSSYVQVIGDTAELPDANLFIQRTLEGLSRDCFRAYRQEAYALMGYSPDPSIDAWRYNRVRAIFHIHPAAEVGLECQK